MSTKHPSRVPRVSSGTEFLIDRYKPSRSVNQFGYDQLYVGNANLDLSVQGTLFESTRALFYSIARGIRSSFLLPSSQPKLYHTLNFCFWFLTASDFEVLASFLIRLEEGSVDVPMEASDIGVETGRAVARASSILGPSVGLFSPPPGVTRGRPVFRKVVVSKHHRQISLSALAVRRSRQFHVRSVSSPTRPSSPEVIKLEEEEEEALAAGHRAPRDPRVKGWIRDFGAALIMSFDLELSG